jgi:hypothetical protein
MASKPKVNATTTKAVQREMRKAGPNATPTGTGGSSKPVEFRVGKAKTVYHGMKSLADKNPSAFARLKTSEIQAVSGGPHGSAAQLMSHRSRILISLGH